MKNNKFYKMDAVEIYKKVLTRELKKFPNGFWQEPQGSQNAIFCTKYMIENILHWTDEDIKNNLNIKIFYKYKLCGMINGIYNESPYKAINTLYPNKFKPWDFISAPQKYWNEETALKALAWLIEEKLQWNDNDIKNNLNQKIFKDNQLSSMLHKIYNNSPYKAINTLYPNKFKPWDFKQVPSNYWNGETALNAMKWLIEERLQWNDEDIKEKLSTRIFETNKLSGMLQTIYRGSTYDAINALYPNKFKKENLKSYSRQV